MRRAVTTDMASRGDGPYSQAVLAGDMLFVSGQGPLHPETSVVVGETIEEQAKVTLNNVKAIVEAADFTMDDVVKVGVLLADMRHFERFNHVYTQFFNTPMPARTCSGAELDGILVEIDVIAKK